MGAMDEFSPVTAVVLAGGLGTRLRGVVDDRPKVLARVGGKPFLCYILEQLSRSGIKNVVLSCGYLGEMIESEIGDTYDRLSITYSHEDEPLGTGGAVRRAIPPVKSSYLLIMNGDSYLDMDLNRFLSWYGDVGTVPGAIVVNAVDDISRFGSVVLSEERKVIKFVEKSGQKAPGMINAGIYIFKKELLENIPLNTPFSLEKEWFPALAAKGILWAYPAACGFIDIGTPHSFAGAGKFFERLMTKKYPHGVFL